MKKLLTALIIFTFISAAWAKSITVQVVQTAPFNSMIEDGTPCEETYVIEDAVMDAMFDAGHIVTNFPTICRTAPSETRDKKGTARSVDNALLGGSKYFVMFFVNYKKDESLLHSPEAVLMENIEGIDWQSYDTRTKQIISEGSERAKVPKKDSRECVTKWAESVARKVLSD